MCVAWAAHIIGMESFSCSWCVSVALFLQDLELQVWTFTGLLYFLNRFPNSTVWLGICFQHVSIGSEGVLCVVSLQCRIILWESNLSHIAWIHLIHLALGKNSTIFPISGISVGCSVSVGTSLQIVPSMSHTAAGIVEPNRLLVPGSQCAILWELFWIVPLFRFVGNNGIYVCSNIVSKFVLKTFGFRRGRTVGSLKKLPCLVFCELCNGGDKQLRHTKCGKLFGKLVYICSNTI